MRRTKTITCQTRQSLLAVAMGGILLLSAPTTHAFEVGLINTYYYPTEPEKLDYGFVAMGRQEIFHYIDLGLRVGVMHSEALKEEYVPILVTGAFKFPLFDGKFVPFVGGFGGFHFFADKYEFGESLGLNGGFDWRFGQSKKWSMFVEGFYDFKDHVHLRSNNAEIPLGGGPGGSIGVSYRF